MPILFALIFLLCFTAVPRAEVASIELKYRLAEDLIEQVRAVLDKGEKVQPAGRYLVLVADGESLHAAKEMIALLDQRQNTYVIRLQSVSRSLYSAENRSGELRLSTDGEGSLTTGHARHLGNSQQNIEQAIRVLEGEVAWLEVGREVPFTTEWAAIIGESAGYAERVEYKTVTTGFFTRPLRRVDDALLLEIEPRIIRQTGGQAGNPPEINFTHLRTRLQVPLGKWFSLAQQFHDTNHLSQAIISWRTKGSRSDQEIYLRIDVGDGFSP